MLKKILTIILSAVLVFGVANVSASESGVDVQSVKYSGMCGENLTWSIDSKGILKISGNGEMPDYNINKSPWNDYGYEINTIIIEDGVKSIGACAFSDPISTGGEGIEEGGDISTAALCDGVKRVSVADSVEKIGELAFYNCVDLIAVSMSANVSEIGKWAFKNCNAIKDVYYSNTLAAWNKIDIKDANDAIKQAELHYLLGFGDCGENLKWQADSYGNLTISGSGKMTDYEYGKAPWSLFGSEVSSIYLSNELEKIGNYAFTNLVNVNNINIPYSVKIMGNGAFYDTDIQEMYVPSRFRESCTNWLDNEDTNVTYYALCEGVKLNEEKMYLEFGKNFKLEPIFTPEDTTNKNVSWNSSKENVCTVDENGLVTAVDTGNAKITVTTEDGGFTATCEIDVIIKATAIEIDKSQETLYMKETLKLNANVLPQNATNKKVIWSSSDESVCTVDGNGLVTPHKNGEAVVYAMVNELPDGNGAAIKSECQISVRTKAESVSLDLSECELLTNGEKILTHTVYPQSASNKNVSYASSNESVAKVDKNGKIIACGKGTATITVITQDGGFTATCDVEVEDYRVKVENIKKDDKISFDVKIETLLQKNGQVVLAQYDDNENIFDISFTDMNSDLKFAKYKLGKKLKIMLWRDKDNITPLADSVEIDI